MHGAAQEGAVFVCLAAFPTLEQGVKYIIPRQRNARNGSRKTQCRQHRLAAQVRHNRPHPQNRNNFIQHRINNAAGFGRHADVNQGLLGHNCFIQKEKRTSLTNNKKQKFFAKAAYFLALRMPYAAIFGSALVCSSCLQPLHWQRHPPPLCPKKPDEPTFNPKATHSQQRPQ